MPGVAVKVTVVPVQIAPDGFAAMVTVTAAGAVTVMVIVLEVTGEPVTHGALLVSTQVITSPVTSVAEE